MFQKGLRVGSHRYIVKLAIEVLKKKSCQDLRPICLVHAFIQKIGCGNLLYSKVFLNINFLYIYIVRF